MNDIRRSFTYYTPPVFTLLLCFFAGPASAQDRNMVCDGGDNASHGLVRLIDQKIKPFRDEITMIDAAVEGLKKIHNPDGKPAPKPTPKPESDKKKSLLEKAKELVEKAKKASKGKQFPRTKPTKERIKDALEAFAVRKAMLQIQIAPLQGKRELVKAAGALFRSIKAEKDLSKAKKDAKKITKALAPAQAESTAKVAYLEARLKFLPTVGKNQPLVATLVAVKKAELEAAKKEATFMGQLMDYAKKLQ